MPTTDEKFQWIFNSLVGNRTGSQQAPRANLNISSDARKSAAIIPLLDSIIAQEEAKIEASRKSRKKEASVSKPSAEESLAREKEVLNDIKDELGGGFKLSIPWRGALDNLSRPFYAVSGGLNDVSEQLIKGEPVWDTADDFLRGAKEGATLEEKVGAGDITELWRAPGALDNLHGSTEVLRKLPAPYAFTELNEWLGKSERGENDAKWNVPLIDLPEIPKINLPDVDIPVIGGALNVAETATNAATGAVSSLDRLTTPQNINRAQGAAGEVGLDPTTYVSGGAVKVLTTTGEVADGLKIAQAAAKVGKEVTEEALPALSKAARTSQANNVAKAIQDVIENGVIDIAGGGNRGRTIFDPQKLMPAAANAGAESLRRFLQVDFDNLVNKYINHINGTAKLPPGQIDAWRASNAQFDAFMNDMGDLLSSNRAKKITSTNDIIKHTSRNPNWDNLINSARRTSSRVNDAPVQDLLNKLQTNFNDLTYSAPGIRVGGKGIYAKRVGKAYAGALGEPVRSLKKVLKPLSYEGQFPGRLGLISLKAKSMGMRHFDEFQGNVVEFARNFSAAERRQVGDALRKGTTLTDARLQGAVDFLRTEYKKMFDDEIAMGVRTTGTTFDPNYEFVWNRGGSQKARAEFKKLRKEHIRNFGTAGKYTIEEAKRLKLRPVEDPFEALLYRSMKSNRDMTRAWFMTDLLEHYGILAKSMTPESVSKRAVDELSNSTLPVQWRTGKMSGDKWYLPKEIKEVYDEFADMSRMDSQRLKQFVRFIDAVNSKFKQFVTIYYPGFHMRNMMGDLFMGFLDGVPASVYGEILSKKNWKAAGKKSPSQFKIADGVYWTHDELMESYLEHARSGSFYNTDVPGSITPGLFPGTVSNKASVVNNKVRAISEHREDFGRVGHYLHALREELPAALKKHSDPDKAMEAAIEASVWRINKYKFDYNALTAIERDVAKRIFPFYTYTRKAIPTLVESLFLSPRNLARLGRIMEYSETSADEFNPLYIPGWQREMGYATLGDEKEPWIMTSAALPTGTLEALSSDDGGIGGLLKSLVAQTAPPIRAIHELSAGRTAYNDRPIDSTIEYLLGQFGPYNAAQQVRSDKKTSEKILAARLGLGLPIDQVNLDQQDYAYQANVKQVFEDKRDEFNRKNEEKGIKIFLSERNDGTTVRVKDSVTGKILFESKDPNAAFEYAQREASRR